MFLYISEVKTTGFLTPSEALRLDASTLLGSPTSAAMMTRPPSAGSPTYSLPVGGTVNIFRNIFQDYLRNLGIF